jgi:hypothetical protein
MSALVGGIVAEHLPFRRRRDEQGGGSAAPGRGDARQVGEDPRHRCSLARLFYGEFVKTRTLIVIAALGLAFPLLLAGYTLVHHGVDVLRDPRVTCGEHVMKPDDTCTHSDDDNGTRKDDYQGMKDNQTADGYFFSIVGGVLLLAGVGLPVLALVRGRRIAARVESALGG